LGKELMTVKTNKFQVFGKFMTSRGRGSKKFYLKRDGICERPPKLQKYSLQKSEKISTKATKIVEKMM
jgi:hypothetical protein